MKLIPLIILVTLLAITVKSQTYISGFISPNMTWTVAGSPYIVTGNALLMQNDTLTIDPGVTIKFDTGTTLQIDGYLIAIGTQINRITFTSNQVTPQAGDWDELHFSDYSADAVIDSSGNYLSGCILKYCDVLNGGNSNFGIIHIESSSPFISHCSIQYSNSSGLYSNITSTMPDSSTINECRDYGIYFSGCGANVINDSISNNLLGGLYLNTSCSITIMNSYFHNNSSHGAIYSPVAIINPILVSHNYFSNNFYDNYFTNDIGIITLKGNSIKFDGNFFTFNYFSGNTSGSLISFGPAWTGVNNTTALWVTNNYISNNGAINGSNIMSASYFNSSVLRGNTFINNSVGDYISAVVGFANTYDTIECNLFQNNQSGNNAYGALGVSMRGPLFISKNIFDGNYNNAANQTSAAHIDCSSGANDTCFFVNNTIRNNLSPSGPCVEFIPNISNQKILQIHDNNFENNSANGAIKLTGNNTGNVNLDFIYLKHNNFSDPNSQCELFNNIPYGSPNVYADSNYWNGTSNQHLDSVIKDYFDIGNLSVVFYQPVLTSPVIIDTSCNGFPTIVAEATENFVNSSPYPNPFTNHTKIIFEKELSNAVLTVFNRYGQKVKEMYHQRGNNISVDCEDLVSGIYFYKVVDNSVIAGSGKLIMIE